MQTSEILNRAADLIEERGWRTGGWGTGTDSAELCLEGGIAAAIGVRYDEGGAGELWRCPAYAAVQSHLGIDPSCRASGSAAPTHGTELWRWNDAWTPDTAESLRTAAEVIEVLRATAVIEAARESELAEVSA